MRGPWALLAALSGLIAVAAGAIGAHGPGLGERGALIDIGVRYQMFHTLAVFAALWLAQAGGTRARWAAAIFLAGVALFSGSLYAMAAGAPRILGFVTMTGGLMFLAGWIAMAAGGLQILMRKGGS